MSPHETRENKSEGERGSSLACTDGELNLCQDSHVGDHLPK